MVNLSLSSKELETLRLALAFWEAHEQEVRHNWINVGTVRAACEHEIDRCREIIRRLSDA